MSMADQPYPASRISSAAAESLSAIAWALSAVTPRASPPSSVKRASGGAFVDWEYLVFGRRGLASKSLRAHIARDLRFAFAHFSHP